MNQYYIWLLDKINSRYFSVTRYNRLLNLLYSTSFYPTVTLDENREMDGVGLRDQFQEENPGVPMSLALAQKPCSVLEVMVALANRCENDIMQNSDYGNRTGLWFSIMISNLGLDSMVDFNFNQRNCELIIQRFLDRAYTYNGEGGMFPLSNPIQDMRRTDLWYQMCWYLNENFEN